MSITVEIEGRGTAEFPDGTDPAVIEQTVKEQVGQAQPKAKLPYDNNQIVEGVPKWGRDNPNLYAGAMTGLDLLPMVANVAKSSLIGIPLAGAINAGAKSIQRNISGEQTTGGDVTGDMIKGMAIEGGGRAINNILGAVTNTPVVKNALNSLSNKFTGMTLKQPTRIKPEVRAQNIDTLHEFGVLPNAKGQDKISQIITATENKLAKGIESGNAAKVRGDFEKAILNMNSLRQEAKYSSDPAYSEKLIDDAIERLVNNPLVDVNGTLPISELQRMKVIQGKEISSSYDKARNINSNNPDFLNKIDKARVRGFKETLEDKLRPNFPELADTNNLLSRLYQAEKANTGAANRIANNQGIGIGLPIKSGAGAGLGAIFGPTGAAIGGAIGTAAGVAEHPSVAPRIGQLLYNASRKKMPEFVKKSVKAAAPAMRAAFESSLLTADDPLGIR